MKRHSNPSRLMDCKRTVSLRSIPLIACCFLGNLAHGQIFGFDHTQWTLNPSASLSGGVSSLGINAAGTELQITGGVPYYESNSAFFNARQPIDNFTASFTWQNLTPPNGSYSPADGIVFTLQNVGLNALGAYGSGLGYEGISPASGVALNLYDFWVPGTGYAPTAVPTRTYLSIAPIDIRSTHPIDVILSYDGTTLSEQLRDTVTGDVFNTSYTVDVVADAGGSLAYVGFTGGNGAGGADQRISNFAFSSVPEPLETSTLTGLALLVCFGVYRRRQLS